MILVVAGSRHLDSYKELEQAIKDAPFLPRCVTEVVSGGCRGVDKVAEQWAKNNNKDLVVFHPNWGKHGRAAGPIRNLRMLTYSWERDKSCFLLAIWDGKSRGTKNIIESAKRFKIDTHVHIVKKYLNK